MDSEIKNKIKSLGPWYQVINFGEGVKSPGISSCGDPLWGQIRELLPKKLRGTRILDIGSNAGIYCIRAALEGAKVIGIEPIESWRKQARFVKKYFEKKHNKKLDIHYMQSRAEDIKKNLGKFDVVLATAVLYYIRRVEQERIVKWICSMTDTVIARYRGSIRMEAFTPIFEKYGFIASSILKEREGKTYYLVTYKKY